MSDTNFYDVFEFHIKSRGTQYFTCYIPGMGKAMLLINDLTKDFEPDFIAEAEVIDKSSHSKRYGSTLRYEAITIFSYLTAEERHNKTLEEELDKALRFAEMDVAEGKFGDYWIKTTLNNLSRQSGHPLADRMQAVKEAAEKNRAAWDAAAPEREARKAEIHAHRELRYGWNLPPLNKVTDLDGKKVVFTGYGKEFKTRKDKELRCYCYWRDATEDEIRNN